MITAQHIHTAKKAIFTALAVVISAYVFVILLTHTPNDPSWSHISSDMGAVSNMGGVVGAWISDLLLTFFGWAAWWLIIFIAHEALSLWLDREQPFGFFRLIAYTLLILTCAGLGAILSPLFGFNDISDAQHGGVLGFELAERLSGLITVYGAGLFFALFALLTLTFAFNIHWREVFKNILNLAWLGSGVKSESKHAHFKEGVDDTTQTADNNSDSQQSGINKNDINDADNETDSPIFEQLALDLNKQSQVNHNHASNQLHDNESNGQQISGVQLTNDRSTHQGLPEDSFDVSDPALSNVLNEFLVNSGLGETILSLKEQEAEEQRLKQAHKQQNPNSTHNGDSQKLEPSFAWNDQNAINELLDGKAQATGDSRERIQAMQQVKHNSGEVEDTNKNTATDTANINNNAHVSSQSASEVENTQQYNKNRFKTHESDNFGSTPIDNTQPLAGSVSGNNNTESFYDGYDDSNGFDNSIDEDEQYLEGYNEIYSEVNNQSYDEQSLENNSINDAPAFNDATSVDLTPTNTPPANPKEPPKIASAISFETPDSDASNHIEDMVPDDEHEQARIHKIIPDIHDDKAFKQSSRAMQTAKYRDGLTPIPGISILDKPDPDKKPSYTQQELTQLSELLEIKLQDFNVKAEVVNAIPGPVVTRFEVELAAGIKASKVTGISRDLARSLSMASLRVVEVIPGKPYIGIEVPNKKREMVRLIELLNTKTYKDPNAQISMAMGKDIGGMPIITDLARAPHMLVAGTTGSGKSVLVNSMLLSMLLKYKPDELRLILIDPKQLELANYNDIPHLLTPVVTDMNEAASSLSWCVAEMERRYQLMSLLKVRKLKEFNKKVLAAEQAGRPIVDPLWRPNDSVSMDKAPKLKTLPMIVIVADEFADMIMQVGKQAEELITRLAQKSRAAGIHLMLATQRPSVDVITGLIKANIPVRAALRVNSKVDSRTILDAGGAEDMLGNGDMLFLGPGQIEPERVHGAYVSDEEVNRVCDAWRERGAPDYIDNMASNFELTSPGSSGGNTSGEDDELYDQAVAFIMETRKVSASSIQRKFSIGYNRAARIVDSMEEAGLVSAMGKSGKRELLM